MIRFLSEEEVNELVNPVLQFQGKSMLNARLSVVAGAFDANGKLVETFTVQLYPMLGPLVKHDAFSRDNGQTTRDLVSFMDDYLNSADVRGYLTIAESPVTERLCERYGMQRVTHPVFIHVPSQDTGRVQ